MASPPIGFVGASLAPSYLAVAWFYGYVAALWTHNVYVAPAVFCTLRYGVVWLADDVRDAPVLAQVRLHVSHIGVLFLGTIVGTAVAVGARTRGGGHIDVSVARANRLHPLGALGLLAAVGLLVAALLGAHSYDGLVAPEALAHVPLVAALLAAVSGAYALLVVAAYYCRDSRAAALHKMRNAAALCALLASAELGHAALYEPHGAALAAAAMVGAAAGLLATCSYAAPPHRRAAAASPSALFAWANGAGCALLLACASFGRWLADGTATLMLLLVASLALLAAGGALHCRRVAVRRGYNWARADGDGVTAVRHGRK